MEFVCADTFIKNLKPKDRRYRIADSNGLAIEVMPIGSKYWRYRYRFNGKATMATIGEYPFTTLAEARGLRNECKLLLTQGINPNIKKAEDKASTKASQNTFEEMFYIWFEHNIESWKPSYQRDIIKRCKKHLLPFIGNKSIVELDTKQLLEVFMVIKEAGTIDTLHKVKGCASRVFKHCVALGLIKYDPIRDLSNDIFKRKKVKHLAHITDPKEFGGLLRMIHKIEASYQIKYALRMAPYVFLRPSELAGLEWSEVDFEDKLLRIRSERMKMNTAHLVPLCPQTVSILRTIQSFKANSKYVFPSTKTNSRHIAPESLRAGLRRMGLSNEEMTTHGFRHTASTLLHELTYNSDFIERQLAHGERNKMKGTYNHAKYLPDRRTMMTEWADYLDDLRGT